MRPVFSLPSLAKNCLDLQIYITGLRSEFATVYWHLQVSDCCPLVFWGPKVTKFLAFFIVIEVVSSLVLS